MTNIDTAAARRPVPMYLHRPDDHKPLDEEGRAWLADQLCSETRVHPDRTMSIGWITSQAAYEYPALLDEIERLRTDNARLREAANASTMIVRNYLYTQREKVEDVPHILLTALGEKA